MWQASVWQTRMSPSASLHISSNNQWKLRSRLSEDIPTKLMGGNTVLPYMSKHFGGMDKSKMLNPVACTDRDTSVGLGNILKRPGEIYSSNKPRIIIGEPDKQSSHEQQHWTFCYAIFQRVSGTVIIGLPQLNPRLQNVMMIFYLILRALDTIEDDVSLSARVKIPILLDFHKHIFDHEWNFSCGSSDCRVLMEEFHFVRQAFLELDKSHQEAIKDVIKRMGAGMAEFIDKEVNTVDELNKYMHYVAGLFAIGFSKIFHISGSEEDLPPENLSESIGAHLQITNITRDYLEDIDEIPRPRLFWPREIWSNYVNNLEDFKCEENSVGALECLNDMVARGLVYADDCLAYLSALKNPGIFRFWAIPQVIAFGTLALCYNNIDVFRFGVKLEQGLKAKILERTRTMSDVYGAFYDFCSVIKQKVDKHDRNAIETLRRLEAIQKTCVESGMLYCSHDTWDRGTNEMFWIVHERIL